ncbi:GGDEF domain-containing protein [Saccharopolyspora sp. NFXS83]|uniref:GGDEF domain-containing protein n=1 Tax=Saccharopolyspora sp. NFXS83 TaxID=2993560 RepID=UPI00224A6CC0|nr:GGDEF domain-containing protein [Saccharopolyspora sp. NFXS83]MCX2729448.1 GGDEF domain-containing protein [Saccharopolyspora sp. NFXS83]
MSRKIAKLLTTALALDWSVARLPVHGRFSTRASEDLGSLRTYVSELQQRTEFWRHYAEVLEAELAAASARAWDVVAEVPLRSTWESLVEARLRGEPERTAVVWADLDRFKEVNDSHGHLAGDAVLREVARRLEAVFMARAPVVTRLGGDEFGVVVRDFVASDLARFGKKMSEPIDLPHGRKIQVSASVGVAIATDVHDGGELEDLLRVAETAAYAEKHAAPRQESSRADRQSAVLGGVR